MRNIGGAVAGGFGSPLNPRLDQLSEEQRNVLLYGSKDGKVGVRHKSYQGRWQEYEHHYEGAVNIVKRRHAETTSETIRQELERYMSDRPCPACRGQRLKPESLSVTIDDRSIAHVAAFS